MASHCFASVYMLTSVPQSDRITFQPETHYQLNVTNRTRYPLIVSNDSNGNPISRIEPDCTWSQPGVKVGQCFVIHDEFDRLLMGFHVTFVDRNVLDNIADLELSGELGWMNVSAPPSTCLDCFHFFPALPWNRIIVPFLLLSCIAVMCMNSFLPRDSESCCTRSGVMMDVKVDVRNVIRTDSYLCNTESEQQHPWEYSIRVSSMNRSSSFLTLEPVDPKYVNNVTQLCRKTIGDSSFGLHLYVYVIWIFLCFFMTHWPYKQESCCDLLIKLYVVTLLLFGAVVSLCVVMDVRMILASPPFLERSNQNVSFSMNCSNQNQSNATTCMYDLIASQNNITQEGVQVMTVTPPQDQRFTIFGVVYVIMISVVLVCHTLFLLCYYLYPFYVRYQFRRPPPNYHGDSRGPIRAEDSSYEFQAMGYRGPNLDYPMDIPPCQPRLRVVQEEPEYPVPQYPLPTHAPSSQYVAPQYPTPLPTAFERIHKERLLNFKDM
eukprot:PhF_6_TR13945/c0_g1_i1/m.22436